MKRLGGDAMDRGVAALGRFRKVAAIHGAPLRAVATSLGVVLADADANALSVGVATNSGGLLDAVVIRCLVVPAVMRLLGPKAWWLPRRLERWLPQLHVEGRPAAFPPPGRDPKPAAEPSHV